MCVCVVAHLFCACVAYNLFVLFRRRNPPFLISRGICGVWPPCRLPTICPLWVRFLRERASMEISLVVGSLRTAATNSIHSGWCCETTTRNKQQPCWLNDYHPFVSCTEPRMVRYVQSHFVLLGALMVCFCCSFLTLSPWSIGYNNNNNMTGPVHNGGCHAHGLA